MPRPRYIFAVPVRVDRRAAERGDEHEPVAVLVAEQRRRATLAASPTARRQQDDAVPVILASMINSSEYGIRR